MKEMTFIERLKAAGGVCKTRDGNYVRVTCYDAQIVCDDGHRYPITGLVANVDGKREFMHMWTDEGKSNPGERNHYLDLVLPDPEMWVNLYRRKDGSFYISPNVHTSKQAAEYAVPSGADYIGAKKLEP